MDRRSIIVLLIGVIASLVGALTALFLEQRRCGDAGGQWNAAARQCELSSGATAGWSGTSLLAGVVVGVLLAVFLYRAVLFFARGGRITR